MSVGLCDRVRLIDFSFTPFATEDRVGSHLRAAKLSKKDKEQLATDVGPVGKNVKFPGFDGSHEPHFHIANYMIDDMKHRFESFKGRNLNSHSPSVDRYQRMFEVFEPMRAGLADRELNLAEITAILKA